MAWLSAVLWLLSSPPVPAWGAEIDSVTQRGEVLQDSAQALNRWLNDRIAVGVETANREPDRCEEDTLYREIRRSFASPFVGHRIAEELNGDETLDLRRVRFADSIYRDLGLFDAISLHWKDLSGVVRVGEQLIGVDKLGHLVVEGWKYFELARRKPGGPEVAMAWGERSERTYFGRYTTGVYAYADLAANFEGMRFWQELLGREADAVGGRRFLRRPYVTCSRRFFFGQPRWKSRRRVDLRDYVTGALDELVNCSDYRNAEIQDAVERRVGEREAIDGVSYACPIDAALCAKARARYGDYAARLLHPQCLAAEPPTRPWWRLW